jgi:hypothetical protein
MLLLLVVMLLLLLLLLMRYRRGWILPGSWTGWYT